MKRKLAGLLGIMVMVLAVAVFYAVAAEDAAKPATETKAAPAPAATEAKAAETKAPEGASAAPASTQTPEEMLARYEERMKSSGASEGNLMRFRQTHTAKFSTDEPIGLLALKDQLKLTPEQIKKIEGAAEAARKEAKAALTKEQVDMLDKMKDTPDTAMTLPMAATRRSGGSRGSRGPGGGGTGGDRPAGGAAGE